MAQQIPTQNNLLDIIKQAVKESTDTINVLVDGLNTVQIPQDAKKKISAIQDFTMSLIQLVDEVAKNTDINKIQKVHKIIESLASLPFKVLLKIQENLGKTVNNLIFALYSPLEKIGFVKLFLAQWKVMELIILAKLFRNYVKEWRKISRDTILAISLTILLINGLAATVWVLSQLDARDIKSARKKLKGLGRFLKRAQNLLECFEESMSVDQIKKIGLTLGAMAGCILLAVLTILLINRSVKLKDLFIVPFKLRLIQTVFVSVLDLLSLLNPNENEIIPKENDFRAILKSLLSMISVVATVWAIMNIIKNIPFVFLATRKIKGYKKVILKILNIMTLIKDSRALKNREDAVKNMLCLLMCTWMFQKIAVVISALPKSMLLSKLYLVIIKGVKKILNQIIEFIESLPEFEKIKEDSKKMVSVSLLVVAFFAVTTTLTLSSTIANAFLVGYPSLVIAIIFTKKAVKRIIRTIHQMIEYTRKHKITLSELKTAAEQITAAVASIAGISLALKTAGLVLDMGTLKIILALIPVTWFVQVYVDKFLLRAVRKMIKATKKNKVSWKDVVEMLKSASVSVASVAAIAKESKEVYKLLGGFKGILKIIGGALAIIMMIPFIILLTKVVMKFNKFMIKATKDTKTGQTAKAALKLGSIYAGIGIIAVSITSVAIFLLPAILGAIPLIAFLLLLIPLTALTALFSQVAVKIADGTKVVPAIIKMIFIFALLNILALSIVLLGVTSMLLVQWLVWAFKGFAGMTSLILMLAGVGYVLTMTWEYIAIAVLLMAAVAVGILIIVAAFWLMFKALESIQDMELDREAIRSNIQVVINTVKDLIIALFSNEDDPEGKNTSFWEKILNGLGMYIGFLVGIPLLLITMASVFLIFLTAAMLRLLQELDLKPDKIKENVGIIGDTANQIIAFITQNPEEKNEKKDFDLIESIIKFVSPGLLKVWQAITAFVYIEIIMVSVLMILLTAAMLRLLQELDLKPDKIKENVGIVFDTANQIINSVFQPDPHEKEKSQWSIFEVVVGAISPGLLKVWQAVVSFVYLTLIMLSVLAVLGISKLLEIIQKIELEDDKIRENVKIVFETAKQIIDAVFQPDEQENKESNKGFLNTIMEFIVPEGLLKVWKALISLGYLALIFGCVFLVKFIAETLSDIQKIQLTEKAISSKVSTVFKVASQVINWVMRDDNSESKESQSWVESILEWTGIAPAARFIKAIMNLGALAFTYMCCGLVYKLAEYLTKFQDIQFRMHGSQTLIEHNVGMIIKTANAIGSFVMSLSDGDVNNVSDEVWKKLNKFYKNFDMLVYPLKGLSMSMQSIASINAENIENAKTNVHVITSALSGVIDALAGNKEKLNNLPKSQAVGRNWFENIASSDFLGAINGANKLSDQVKTYSIKIGELINISSSYKTEEIKSAGDRVRFGISAFKDILKDLDSLVLKNNGDDASQALNLIDRVNRSIQRFTHVTGTDVKNAKDLTDNYITFLNKVNSMDLVKLKTTEQLMKHWADMSMSINGNFRGLANTINQNIMPALKKLDKSMSEAAKTQEQIITELTAPINVSQLSSTAGPTGEIPVGDQSNPSSAPGTSPFSSSGLPSVTPKKDNSQGAGDIDDSGIEENNDYNLGMARRGENNEPLQDTPNTFLAPYGVKPVSNKKSPLERCIDGDAIRVKIIN